MSERIEEKSLILPALYFINEAGKLNTSEIIKKLTDALSPAGEDAEILAGRSDTKFSQKVRNLMGSHYSSNGMNELTTKSSDGYFSLTGQGKHLLDDNIESINILLNATFGYDGVKAVSGAIQKTSKNRGEKAFIYDENTVIEEGSVKTVSAKRKQRSKKLREAAIAKYTEADGTIKCAVCGFDFRKTYGKLGEGYIAIHHEVPIFQMPSEGTTTFINKAIQNVKPVCPNCHSMIHRNKNKMLSIQELKDIIEKNKD